MTNKVKYAPKAVIDELDSIVKQLNRPFKLRPFGIVAEMTKKNPRVKLSQELLILLSSQEGQIKTFNHIADIERLQPERETRYYVEFYDGDGYRTLIYSSSYLPVKLDIDLTYIPKYKEGLDHKTAEKAQALYGGDGRAHV